MGMVSLKIYRTCLPDRQVDNQGTGFGNESKKEARKAG